MSRGRDGAAQLPGNPTRIVVFATAATDDGGPAAAMPWDQGTVVERLIAQFADIGVSRAHVITRPEWAGEIRKALALLDPQPSVEASPGPSEDLARAAQIARDEDGGVVFALGDIVTHREVLAGLLMRPGVVTGALSSAGRHGSPFAFPSRSARGRIVSASSPYHAVAGQKTAFLGVLKVAQDDLPVLVEVAERLAGLMADGLPEGWERELEHKAEQWRLSQAKSVLRAEREVLEAAGNPPPEMSPEEYVERRRAVARELPPAEEAEYARRLTAARQDVVSLLLVGLVRSGLHVGQSFVRRFFWARPLTPEGVARVADEIRDYDEDRLLLDSAVKGADGFFTTFFVSTWSRYVARWAARRGLTPNQITTVSLFIGVLAAAAFATGEREGLVAGAVLLYLSFVTDCVDGQLARYTRQFSKFGAWLDSVFDRTKEYLAFAGLAIGANTDEVWLLAGAMLTLQTMRHAFDFSYGATDRQAISDTEQPPVEQSPDAAAAKSRMSSRGTIEARLGALKPNARVPIENSDTPPPTRRQPLARRILGGWRVLDRVPGLVWLKRMAAFPIGERFAVVCITAALFTPRTTFIVLLVWGGFALLYTSTGRTLRSLVRWRSTVA